MSSTTGYTASGKDYLRSAPADGRGFMGGLDSAVRENPVSAALIGMGVLWMFFGGSKVTSLAAVLPGVAKDAVGGAASSLSSGARAAFTGVASAADRAKDLGGAVSDTVQQAAAGAYAAGRDALASTGEVAGAVSDGLARIQAQAPDASGYAAEVASGLAGTVQGNLRQTFERQPLLLGAIGLALGAGIGAALPTTEFEEEHLGETASQFVESAKEFADEKVETLTSMAQRVFEEAKSEAEQQGLTPGAAKDALKGVGEKLSSIAGTARQKAPKLSS